jgi:threonine dehydratase
MVSVQNGKEHVSTVVLGREELDEQMKAEAEMHVVAGWEVLKSRDGLWMMARKGNIVREVFVREYDALKDISS